MKDANERLHQDWLGMAQPDGLVVTATALKAAEANITWPVIELQVALRELAGETKVVLDVRRFLDDILGWSSEFVVEREQLPETMKVPLDGGDFLTPHFAVRSADEDGKFIVLVGLPEKLGGDLDAANDDKRWTATPHQKFERLLRETGVHVGLLTNGRVFRLVYAPKGETAGWINFRVAEMLSVDGRPLLGAIHMLLNQRRLLSLEPEKRLHGLLKASREYQNTVSDALREQVIAALRELLHGFEHADRVACGAILAELRREHLQEVYVGLVTVLMRMVFVLFAEERGLLPMENDLYASSYSLTRLYAQLLEERGRFGDDPDDRYGAWARVITLFRVLHDGVKAADGLVLPARKGDFFDSNAFPFLEGRPRGSARQVGESLDVPRISDGVVFRVLDQLLVLGGERLQYRGLDVEQIGSVYEGLMGFEVEVAEGPSLCVTPEHVVVNLEELLRQPGPERAKALKGKAGLDLKDKAGAEVKAAKTVDALQAALSRRNSSRQPGLISTGALYLQPGEERRKSGSHYTPKSLTAPIVETTLRPVLERLGPDITPEQILDLKICDPAMGSAAFLVEACRQLADLLVAAWRRTNSMPELPPDEDPVLHARRLIAQRCLYGVDKNPLAVDLARLSMWLVTFAKGHPFTFVDHALRCGDSLVGLTRDQIVSMSLDVKVGEQVGVIRPAVESAVKRAEQLRREIQAIGDPPDTAKLAALWRDTNEALDTVRDLGDLVVAAFFSTDSDKTRRKAMEKVAEQAASWLQTGANDAVLRGMLADLREGPKGIRPFHWEIEFPEVFGDGAGIARRRRRDVSRGFRAIVGNPPWVSYAGRAAQPLDERLRGYFMSFYDAFGGYRNLQALFVERSVSHLLGPQGRVGLVLPSSMAELEGYGFSRAAHSRSAECDAELPDLGEDSFRGVFQPSMVLHSTRRVEECDATADPWPIARPDLDTDALRILRSLKGDVLPPTLFGERGLQSSGEDVAHLLGAAGEGTVPIRVGSDIHSFRRSTPSLHADGEWFEMRLRAPSEWASVKVLIRQTARVPIAARSDGAAFRNSILAGFEGNMYSADFLVAYLNSTPVRWHHYYRHRDARYGMPQVKIGHLRSIPAPRDLKVTGSIADLGATWSKRNTGLAADEQRRLDEIVATALQIGRDDLDRMIRDAGAWS